MKKFPAPSHRTMAFVVAVPLVVAACAGAVAERAPDSDSAAAATIETPGPEAAGGAIDEAPAADPGAPAKPATWLDLELTDAASGETFTLASLQGQVVALEPMAIWCTNCKAQQDNVKQVYPEITASGIRYISLGVDPGENERALARYAERREYPWTFAQSSVEFSRALADLFGPQILSVPSTPLILLDADGEVVLQEFGFHGPDRLLELLGEAVA